MIYVRHCSRAGGAHKVECDVEDSLSQLSPDQKARLTTALIEHRKTGDASPEVTKDVAETHFSLWQDMLPSSSSWRA